MGTDLAVIDRELTARKPVFAQLLPPSVTPDKLMRTVMMSIERNPRLLNCTVQSIVNAATTAAVLGVECDGVTGQGYIVPYGNVATFQLGYKGYNTIAARAGYTITGSVVREGDAFAYELGSDPYVKHKPHHTRGARIVGAWACATSNHRPPIIRYMPIEEIEDVKARSQGAKKPDSPWNDPFVGYPSMCEKTVKRRLARDMPMSVMQQAAALDASVDIGKSAHLDVSGEMHTEAEGPKAEGVIIDVQPEDLTTPVGWPDHRTIKAFYEYSLKVLNDEPTRAKEWHDHYRSKLDSMFASAHKDVRFAYDELMGIYKEIVAD